jgi:hypothetical protein
MSKETAPSKHTENQPASGAASARRLSNEVPTLPDDQAWEAVKQRRPVGQVVFGEAVQIEVWGAFFDIGERFLAFIDPLDLVGKEVTLGARRSLKILQHAEWNRQIRSMIVDEGSASQPNGASS